MLVNSQAISVNVLYHTLTQQVTRLRQKYSQDNLQCLERRYRSAAENVASLNMRLVDKKNQQTLKTQCSIDINEQIPQDKLKKCQRRMMQRSCENKKMITDLRLCVSSIRSLQNQIKSQEQMKKQMHTQLRNIQERIASTNLKSEDKISQIAELHQKQLQLKESKLQSRSNCGGLKGDLASQTNLKKVVTQQNEVLLREVDSLRRKLLLITKNTQREVNQSQKGVIQEKQKQNELRLLINTKRKSISFVEQQIARTILDRNHSQKALASIQQTNKQISSKIAHTMKLSQDIESKIFKTKVSQTDTTTKNHEMKHNITLLKGFKDKFMNLIGQI